MPYGEHFGCDYCGRMVPPSAHDDDCPVRIWRLHEDSAPSALRVRPLADGTVRVSDAVRIAREVTVGGGKAWESIPRGDQQSVVQWIVAIVYGAEQTGWKFQRPEAMLVLRAAPFLIPTREQIRAIVEAIDDYQALPTIIWRDGSERDSYERNVVKALVCATLASMSQLGWGIVAPEDRRPIHEGGFRELS